MVNVQTWKDFIFILWNSISRIFESNKIFSLLQDFSDMVANKAAQQKRKAASKESAKAKKQKDKDFQF